MRFGPGSNLWLVLVLFWAFLMGPRVVTPPFAWSGFDLGFFVGTCLFWLGEVPWVYRLLEMVQEGCPGHGPVHALVASARRIGFRGDLAMPGGRGRVFLACYCSAWRSKVSADLCAKNGFQGGPFLDFSWFASAPYFFSCSGKKQGALTRRHGWCVSGMVFCLVRCVGEAVPCRFCGGADVDGHLF